MYHLSINIFIAYQAKMLGNDISIILSLGVMPKYYITGYQLSKAGAYKKIADNHNLLRIEKGGGVCEYYMFLKIRFSKVFGQFSLMFAR